MRHSDLQQRKFHACQMNFRWTESDLSTPRPAELSPVCASMKAALLDDGLGYFHRCRLTHLAESGGAALGDLGLQRADKLAQLHAVIQLLHEELCSHLLAWKSGKIQNKSSSSSARAFCKDLTHLISLCLSKPHQTRVYYNIFLLRRCLLL